MSRCGLWIEKGATRLFFDPATAYLRIDWKGGGPGIELTDAERIQLSKALWYSVAEAKRR